MHLYQCSECDGKTFATWFAPVFNMPAFCPCCGKDRTVAYKGEKDSIQTDELEGMI